MLTRIALLALMLIAALGVAGCGDDDSSSDDSSSTKDSGSATESTTASTAMETTDTPAGDEGTVLELGAVDNELKFDKTELTAPAGTVTLKLTNDSSIPHNVALKKGDETMGEAGELVSGGEVSTTTVDLEPGEYTYYCSPHESSGMTGTLTIT